MAIACSPSVLIADEPTTALDVTIQAQILALMGELKRKLNTATILITHNLGVVAQVCDRVIVMYAGRIVESAPVMDLFKNPRHPYTKALMDSIPKRGAKVHGQRLATIEGMVPSLRNLPKGCRFNNRCKFAQQKCVDEEPGMTVQNGRTFRCHFPIERGATLTVSAT